MGCVNKSSREFKNLAARNNLDSNALELIVHKYWMETGNETLFPTDIYIQAQMGNVQYQESGKSIRKVWEKYYSSPKTYSSLRSLENAKAHAMQFFPRSAIVYYKNSKGNFVLSVKRPVAKVNKDKDAFFEEADKMGSMKDAKKINLGIKDNQTYGIGKVQELYNRFNLDRTSKALADKVFGIAQELNLTISFNESLPFGNVGRYTNNNTITFKKSWLERDMMNEKKAPIILHEVLHALSMYALSNQTKNWKRPEILEEFRTEMNSLYQDLKSNPMLKGERGIVDVKEFVAELANPVFRAKIQNIDRENKAAQKNDKKSFWTRIIDAFKNLLGLHVTNTYYQRSMNALDKALSSFDVDAYMRYNGIKNQLRQGYNAKEWEFNSMSDAELKFEVKNYLNKETAKEHGIVPTKIKPQYKGKLIYAQSGTGKTTIADNITVFDSDYILGQVLGVSTETAGFFFKTLSAKQKEVFGQKYREAIKQKIAEGYTVVTANESLLPDADVVVYNSSAEQADERVNRADREINNRYHAIDYHNSTLSKIKELKENDKENRKEYHALDGDHYLADIISNKSNSQSSNSNLRHNTDQKESNALLREQIISDFLNEFGITVRTLNSYDGDLPLFDALNRVINAKNPSDITEGVGYAIAFMMQGDPEMQRMIVKSHFGMKGDFNKKVPIINKTVKNLHPTQNSEVAREVLREVGRQIASELRDNFGTPIEEVKSKKSIWTIIKNFFTKIGMKVIAVGKRGEVKNNEKLFVKDIIAALGREDFSRIKGPRIKEDSYELAQQVDVETALKENPYEDGIIRKLGEHGIALAGSTSIALQGSLYRPSENPLHDIDFNAGNNSSKESLDKLLPKLFPNDTIQFSHALKKDKKGDQTVTYITLSEPFEIKNIGFDTAEFYGKDGKYLGKRKHYDLFLEDGVQGKMLDFFTGPTQESNHGFYTKTINGYNYLLSESNAAMAAKILWARPKDMWDYKNFKRFDFINSMSGQQLRDELSVIKQESADYDLVNGVEPEHKHSGKAVPQDFTFADGTKIKAPFRPNGQQVDALNEMDRFMKSDETSMTLSGYAGTGKTSLMEMIAMKGRRQHRPVLFCATTNKAAAVLNDRVSKAGFQATTLNKTFGINVEIDPNSKSYNAKNLVNVVKDVSIDRGTTVIIDEASMINEENYKILNGIAKENKLKIIYVGDEAQLPPVNETQVSKVFRNGEGKVIRLTQVERTDDNAILKEATALRNGERLSGESSFNAKKEGVAYIAPEHKDAVGEVIEKYVKGLKSDPNYFRILAYTNKAVSAYNNQVRELLGYTSPIPQKGEPMMGYKQWGYDWRTKSYRLVNSESYTVTATHKPLKSKLKLNDGTEVTMEYIPITLVDSMGKSDTFNFMDVKNNEQNRLAATMLAKEKKWLWGQWKIAPGKSAKAEILQKINGIDAFLFINDNIMDEEATGKNKPVLAEKVIDFGYAMTIHKSQGSTFTHVLIDDVDVSIASMKDNNMSNAMEMVDLEEDNGNVPNESNLTGELEDVELDLSGEEDAAPTTSKQEVNLRRQLEYVGVSRATDTVTIISNNVKKEGSPLHPEQSIKEDKPKVEKQSTIPEQLIEHLKSQGINVLGREAMAEFLKTHNLKYLQQMVSNYYMPLEDAEEVEVLRHDLFGKFKDKSSFGCIGRTANYWYLCDYFGDSNYKVRAQIFIDGNEQFLNAFEDAVRGKTFRDAEGFNRWFETFRTTQGKHYNGWADAKIRITTNGNAGVAISKLQGSQTANKGRGNGYGSVYNAEHEIETFTTPQGEVYGFVDKDGNIYLDETKISPNHPIHEYTHLWDRTVQQKNPKLWQRGVELMKQTSLWNEILNDGNYGKQWQSMNLPQEKLDNLIASEVHARFTGEGGEQLLNNLAKNKGQEGIIGKLKQWILDMWKEVKATFGNWSQEDLDKLTLRDFNHMTVRDFTEGVNLKETSNVTYTTENTIKEEEVKTNVEQPSLPEATTQMIELPGYEYFNDLYDHISVDAEWKVSYLKELDSQLSNEKSAEENQKILNTMDKIFSATSKEEYLQEANSTKEKKIQKVLDEYDKLIKQINNLLGDKQILDDGETLWDLEKEDIGRLSASEIRHTAELIANNISDMITQLKTEEGYAEKMFPTFSSKIDLKTATRKKVVEAIGIDNLINKAKEKFDPETSDFEITNIDDSIHASLITQNWDAMMYLAADVFAFNENFGITKDYTEGNFITVDQAKVDFDNFNDYSNDPDVAAEEGEKDEQEHWQIESRTIDVLNSMSELVRQGLHECYLLDADGNKVISKWGIPERVNPRKTVNSILRWTQNSQSLEDMVNKLSAKQKTNPWLSQLISRLSDKTGNETDFQSQFYSVFSKAFQLYSIVLLEDGKYYSINVNSKPALSEIMQSITAQYKVGEHALFSGGKVNSKLLGNENAVGKNDDFSLHKALYEMQAIDKALKKGTALDEDMIKSATENIMGVCRIIGYPITEDVLADIVNADSIQSMTKYLMFMVRDLTKALNAQNQGKLHNYDPFKFKGEYGIEGTLKNFLLPISEKLEDTAIAAFYDSGKMYQSYVIPSFMTNLMNKFKLDGQEFEDFIWEQYGSSEWFKYDDYDIRNGWRNDWLRRLVLDHKNSRKVFDHKVELNFNKHNYMRNMDDLEYTVSLITEYFAESTDKSDDMALSWYRIPMQSNKPSSEFIKFYSYRGMGYKKTITNELHNMFLQELSRIQTVRMRNLSESDKGFIKNFDINGRKFNFLPAFNSYLENTETDKAKRTILRNEDGSVSSENNRLATLLQKKIKGEEALTEYEAAELNKLADKVIMQSTDDRIQSILDRWESQGVIEASKSIKGIYPSSLKDEEATTYVREQIENFLWNDTYAAKNILQLTIGDIAFYENAENLQKRLSQLHAPGVRGRKEATDYEGNRVSDGKYRTMILRDFDTFKSNIIANISEVFDRKIANASEEQKPVMRALKESLVGEKGKFTQINVTDAQGFSSPSSYRKKAFIFGKWSRKAEDIYQKLKSGKHNYTDLETAFQPLKPFVYSKLTKDMGVENAPIHSMQVPFQAKNSEYLLIMADAILQGQELSRPNMLRAIYRVMEDSESLMPTKGIDTVQFESAIKSGLQGALNIHQFMEMPGGEEAAYTYMKEHIFTEEYDQSTGERVYRNYDVNNYVHEISYDNYCLQQEVPEHFKEHSQAHGSQIRMIIPSDLDLYTTDEAGNQIDNYYEWTEPDGTKRKVKADEFRKEYEETIAENIKESISLLETELHLDSQDKRERNIALARILQNEIISSPRYGIDLVQACSIDKETGEFRIPKGDPIQAKRIEQLINSVIKSRINKQKIAGGPIVQVSNFGTSKQLHIRFNDKDGNLMPLESEYNPSEHGGKSYKDYCHENQGGIAYFEVFAPIWSNEIFEKFANPDGTINVAAIEATSPELLKMVSYRIPTEDKYSCAPMKVVGFMPKEAGDAIMFPYELTEIDDSDFDIDKRYVMRKDIPIKEKDVSEYIGELEKRGEKLYKELYKIDAAEGYVLRTINDMLKNPRKFNTDSPFRKALFSEYQKLAFKAVAPTSGRFYRDNKIIDMTYAVLINKMTADKILNPGGFDTPRKMGYMVAAYKNSADKGVRWEDLQNMSTKELKNLSYVDKDLTFADTQVQFYKQNSAASSLIGVFAVNKVAHATLESNDIYMDIDNVLGEDASFNIGGHYEIDPDTKEKVIVGGITFEKRMQVDPRYDKEGNLIGKTLGSLVSASADAVKDPILNLMNINMTTAGMFNTMLRLGMNFDDAALFLSQDIIGRLLNQFNRENLSGYESLDSIINKWLTKYREKESINDASDINSEALTKEELIEGLTSNKHEDIDYKVLMAFQKLRSMTDAMRKPTFVTRLNSISSAVGPLIVDNLIMEHKMDGFTLSKMKDESPFCTADGTPIDKNSILANHPILEQFSRAADIAKGLFIDMPAGSTGFRKLLDTLKEGIADKMYGDKKLLDQFSNFYQSYLLVQSGMVKTEDLSYYVNKFPKEFMDKKFKEKYPDNELIKAIKFNVSKVGKPYLTIKITGMEEQAKEELRSAWMDLHREDPKLSQDLFNYSFFVAGIGFSPKTFMALVPTIVKEKLKSEDGKASYVDTYRNFPEIVPSIVTNQFIRNNWGNNKLVPMKGGKNTHYNVDLKRGTLKVYRAEEKADLADVEYIKTKTNGNTYLWQFVRKENEDLVYKMISPLGNNGEYLEMSLSDIGKSMQETLDTKENNEPSPLKEASASETSGLEETGNKQPMSATEVAKKTSEIVELIIKQNPKYSAAEAEALKEKMIGHEKQFARFLQNVFKHKGLDLTTDEAINEFKKYC